uniref:Uncharacterized protein n=1 Tax=Aegilops tauschii subsp. strangulata TaxID=200361 RepID=A0A453S766_AEGTS
LTQERAYVSSYIAPGPLPEESTFVVDARDSIPQRRTTTTATNTVRGAARGRGVGRASEEQIDETGTSSNAGRGNKRQKQNSNATGRGGGGGGARGREGGRRGARGRGGREGARGRGGGNGAATFPGQGLYNLFGPDGATAATETTNAFIPDLNASVEEIPLSQHAPHFNLKNRSFVLVNKFVCSSTS